MVDREPDLTKSQLFLDDTWIEEQSMLTRIWHKPHLYPEPVMRAEKPWEGTNLAFYGTEDQSPARHGAVIRWPGDGSMNALAGRDVRLAFFMRDAHLYSFRSSGVE